MVGRTLEGRYTIVAKLGAGSMGTVYRAEQDAVGREVAIKILRGDRAVDDAAKARFMREARANSLLASPQHGHRLRLRRRPRTARSTSRWSCSRARASASA